MGRFLYHSAAVPRDERCEVSRRNADGVQDADVRELAASAQAVDRRGTDAEEARDLGYAEQIFLDPRTQRFVFGRCAFGRFVDRPVVASQMVSQVWDLSGAPWRIGNPGLPNCQGEGRRFEPGVPLHMAPNSLRNVSGFGAIVFFRQRRRSGVRGRRLGLSRKHRENKLLAPVDTNRPNASGGGLAHAGHTNCASSAYALH